jgi:hypothetical protein
MGRMNSEKLFWKAHVCIIQVEHKTKADKERDRKINSISLEMSLENREEANEYTVILAFGGGGGILYISFYCTTSLITDYKYTYVTINGL